MDSGTLMFVAEYGSSGGRYVSGLRIAEGTVIIETDLEEWAK